MQSAYLYRVVAQVESGTVREALFTELAQAAERQAQIWMEKARQSGISLPSRYDPDGRTRIVAYLVRNLGPYRMRSILAAMKVRGMSLYTKGPAGHGMPSHVRDIDTHSAIGGGNLRAAVFGVNDGLVSNASLILGVAGAASDNYIIVLSGIAGLLAGAFSMAAGEYVSVRSQREMYEYQIGLERDELDQYPEEEAAELTLIYKARGFSTSDAERMAGTVLNNPNEALDTLAKEELGLNPTELGSPWGAAIFSFVSFAAGAAIPLLPFILSGGKNSLLFTVVLTGFALFTVGAVLSLFTGRHAFRGGLRMLAIGASAGAATYLIGHLLGVGLS
jgi:VIT1/CCC1 family predicted Fe2+/Mn2+ transporter